MSLATPIIEDLERQVAELKELATLHLYEHTHTDEPECKQCQRSIELRKKYGVPA